MARPDSPRARATLPSGGRFTLVEMVVRARLTCSDPDCEVVYEAVGPLEDLEALACDCGCGLELLGLPERVESRSGRFRRVQLHLLVG